MKFDLTYKISALVLAIMFSLFSVGLPIVISACPMMKATVAKTKCCCDMNSSGEIQVTKVKNSSCCKTVFAASRNTTEYIQSNGQSVEIIKIAYPAIIPSTDVNSIQSLSFAVTNSSPPLLSEDILLFTSSFRI